MKKNKFRKPIQKQAKADRRDFVNLDLYRHEIDLMKANLEKWPVQSFSKEEYDEWLLFAAIIK